jgi:hypothetical protein
VRRDDDSELAFLLVFWTVFDGCGGNWRWKVVWWTTLSLDGRRDVRMWARDVMLWCLGRSLCGCARDIGMRR